jgi:hypothetical protein
MCMPCTECAAALGMCSCWTCLIHLCSACWEAAAPTAVLPLSGACLALDKRLALVYGYQKCYKVLLSAVTMAG